MKFGYQGGEDHGTDGEMPRTICRTYELGGVVLYPHYVMSDFYALPEKIRGCPRTISGERLRMLGAIEGTRILWARRQHGIG